MKKSNKIRTTVVLGSGGHTGEMLRLLEGIDFFKFDHIDFVVANTDKMSVQKIRQLEENLKSRSFNVETSTNLIRRSRSVGQKYFSSVFTTILAIFCAIPLIFKTKPNLLLVNGPGTIIPLCIIVYIFSLFYILSPKCKIIYVESVCRAQKLSLTGTILYHMHIVDKIIVQWPDLQSKYPKSIYLGRLV